MLQSIFGDIKIWHFECKGEVRFYVCGKKIKSVLTLREYSSRCCSPKEKIGRGIRIDVRHAPPTYGLSGVMPSARRASSERRSPSRVSILTSRICCLPGPYLLPVRPTHGRYKYACVRQIAYGHAMLFYAAITTVIA